jgi:hypothetical protein
MERSSPGKEGEERKLDHICAVEGSAIIPGFGVLQVDLNQAVRELLIAVAFVPGAPGSNIVSRLYTIRLWAEVEYAAASSENSDPLNSRNSEPFGKSGKN